MVDAPSELLPSGVYTLREACHYLRISEATARRWLKDGRLRGRKLGRDYRFLGRDLLASVGVGEEIPVIKAVHLFGPDHPLLKLAGIGDSGLGDVAEEHDRYLAEATRDEW